MLVDGGSERDPSGTCRGPPNCRKPALERLARHSPFGRYMKAQLRLAGGRRKPGRHGFSSDTPRGCMTLPYICATCATCQAVWATHLGEVRPGKHSINFCPRRMCTTKQAQNPGQHHEPSNAVEGSSSQVAVLESEDLLASIVACIFDKPSYMTLVYVVSKAFHHAFHHARKINNGYWRRTNPPPPPRRPLPMRLKTTCNGQECAFVQKGSKLLPLIKEKYNLTVDGMFL